MIGETAVKGGEAGVADSRDGGEPVLEDEKIKEMLDPSPQYAIGGRVFRCLNGMFSAEATPCGR
ncbi:hypothetical protein [Actinomadura terrae]|uniref:hypothetical protein n=1 Tax=Actinomadura terrae TaxID=604353 RepID=UPI001FA791CF|nr:hypothetical protein [Actinomadura terrae]